jgi:transcription initiation factor TFIIIB Brf1 subunit/transcription initiation factor TFIIB
MIHEPTFEQFVHLCLDADDMLRRLRRSKFGPQLQGKKPSGLKAAITWLLAQQKKLHVTQHHLSLIFGNTEVTVRDDAHLLKPMVTQIIKENNNIDEGN